MARSTFADGGPTDGMIASAGAVANTVTRTNLFNPALWGLIPAFDMRAGKIYKLICGGTMQAAAPTIIFNPTMGTSATPSSNTALGVSNTVTLGTVAASSAWFAEFYLVVRSVGVAASGTTVTGSGFVNLDGAAAAISTILSIGGSVPTTIDHTINQGLCLDVTWGTASASNTITCQYAAVLPQN